ncbi:MAG TPA: hypothetical protein VF691_03970 [Cytophagaceae bacterium]|jgi:hypothetical protein
MKISLIVTFLFSILTCLPVGETMAAANDPGSPFLTDKANADNGFESTSFPTKFDEQPLEHEEGIPDFFDSDPDDFSNPTDVPLDGGASILLLAGAGIAARGLRRKEKNKKEA